MFRKGEFPGLAILRTGTVDDFSLAETKLRPQVEQFVETQVAWQRPIRGCHRSWSSVAYAGGS